ncbi:PREDICTED: tripartite motif-containing protein 52-like [Calidris pugnax]|uniref:tripartite motif-containing protein 52-like n=1 Tax=Calidris pugnax TaxID=198806 RepID=UPI00071D56B1|nr:PREDICTED: tripartite motif-containing protein 52-like [Calidris pugnax]
MAARTPLEILQDEARCSICLEIFQDPVSIHCGHNFCRSCITRTWEGQNTNFSCPQCREMEDQMSLRPNRELANVIEAAKRSNKEPAREVEGGENLCEKHKEPLKLFCQEDKRLICLVCDRSEVHRNHSVVPVDEAAKQYKKQIQTQLHLLKSEQEALQSSVMDRLDRIQDHTLEQLDPEITKAHEEILQRLLEETTSLGTLSEEMERTYQQRDWQLLKVRAQAFQTGWEGPP